MKNHFSPEVIFKKANISPTVCLFCHPNEGMEIHQTENFRILRVNFPAAAGHIMISSKQHFGSLGEVDSQFIPELENLKNTIENWFRLNLGHVLFYEHGRAGSCHSTDEFGQQCEHFHLNCIPANVCIHKHLKYLPKNFKLSSIKEMGDLFDSYGEYLYFENDQKEARSYSLLKTKIPSHFLRTLICGELNTPDKANWQKYQKYEDFLENFNLTIPLQTYLSMLKNDLF